MYNLILSSLKLEYVVVIRWKSPNEPILNVVYFPLPLIHYSLLLRARVRRKIMFVIFENYLSKTRIETWKANEESQPTNLSLYSMFVIISFRPKNSSGELEANSWHRFDAHFLSCCSDFVFPSADISTKNTKQMDGKFQRCVIRYFDEFGSKKWKFFLFLAWSTRLPIFFLFKDDMTTSNK